MTVIINGKLYAGNNAVFGRKRHKQFQGLNPTSRSHSWRSGMKAAARCALASKLFGIWAGLAVTLFVNPVMGSEYHVSKPEIASIVRLGDNEFGAIFGSMTWGSGKDIIILSPAPEVNFALSESTHLQIVNGYAHARATGLVAWTQEASSGQRMVNSINSWIERVAKCLYSEIGIANQCPSRSATNVLKHSDETPMLYAASFIQRNFPGEERVHDYKRPISAFQGKPAERNLLGGRISRTLSSKNGLLSVVGLSNSSVPEPTGSNDQEHSRSSQNKRVERDRIFESKSNEVLAFLGALAGISLFLSLAVLSGLANFAHARSRAIHGKRSEDA